MVGTFLSGSFEGGFPGLRVQLVETTLLSSASRILFLPADKYKSLVQFNIHVYFQVEPKFSEDSDFFQRVRLNIISK